MKAIICPQYGSPDVLRLQEIPRPVPEVDEALVRIHASSINAADLEILRGNWSARFSGPFRPGVKILGTDIAGTIEATGRDVQGFQPGDEVWGDLSFPLGNGAFAEFVCVPQQALRLKPPNLSFEEAAAVPTAAVVALQNLRAARPASFSPILATNGTVQPGQKVLINGAGGGVGSFALQLAKSFGAEVTGVDSGQKWDLMRSLGADHVIDYHEQDFTHSGEHYDLILEVVARRSIFDYRKALAENGVFVYIGGSLKTVLQAFLISPFISRRSSKTIGVVPWKPNDKDDLARLQTAIEAGTVKPVIDRCYPLNEVPEALHYMEAGRTRGKVVISVVS